MEERGCARKGGRGGFVGVEGGVDSGVGSVEVAICCRRRFMGLSEKFRIGAAKENPIYQCGN
jgi:hypothetical protein